jgi:hypothetical protein
MCHRSLIPCSMFLKKVLMPAPIFGFVGAVGFWGKAGSRCSHREPAASEESQGVWHLLM